MFEFIKGRVSDCFIDRVIIEVNGIGYKVYSTTNSIAELKQGQIATVYTYFSVREDEINLYGFTHKDELDMFKMLISVSRIGPKLAIAILSTYSPFRLAKYIVNKDINNIIKTPGVGKKTAERIILELRDKVKHYDIKIDDENADIFENSYEVVDALVALGYNKQEAENALYAVDIADVSIEEGIKKALKILMK